MSDLVRFEQYLENLWRARENSNSGATEGTWVVAFSGGVDSSVVAAMLHRFTQRTNVIDRAIAVTAVSPSLASWQRRLARDVAGKIGIEHREMATHENEREEYIRNDSQRCYYCKETLYSTLQNLIADTLATERTATVFSGTNADDLGDYRPGLLAGRQAGVLTPLADLGMGKQAVRELAQDLGLPNAELPASPCLSSRIAYGVEVTPERLAMIDRAESFLRDLGFDVVRVRLHEDEAARIEVVKERVSELTTDERLSELNDVLKRIGFSQVTIDPNGFRSGNLNDAHRRPQFVSLEATSS